MRVVDSENATDLPPLFRKSDKEGVAEFPELLPGSYVLDAQLHNYVPIKQFVNAGADLGVQRTLLRRNEFEKIEKKALRDLDNAEFLDAARGIEDLLEFYPEDGYLHDTLARAYAGWMTRAGRWKQLGRQQGWNPSDSPRRTFACKECS